MGRVEALQNRIDFLAGGEGREGRLRNEDRRGVSVVLVRQMYIKEVQVSGEWWGLQIFCIIFNLSS